ncbi:mannan-binding lectin serine protease 2-like [Neocloeon triangulifer]|uniref:mannan-binding lectin serine protease 2-like n=1 Tax=Neocloeon triangulifer TaxID=2078957 RepID=UPI00286F1941|nr:mannan-binding lectin serine protease 2-like [Neocloeon triangulifer]
MKKKFSSKYMRPTENFCAGIPQTQTSACKGDSGGGLTFYDRDDTERHFLRGVVSMGSVKKFPDDFVTCNPKFYALYTDVTNYMDWIVQNSPDINV